MSWKMTAEVRQERLAGRLPGAGFTEFAVLFIMADTCRGDSRIASLGVTELVNLTGLDRTTIWRAIKQLVALRYVTKFGRSNQYQASRFDVLPGARCTDATCTETQARCTDATCTGEVHVAADEVHVASGEVHVANRGSARCTDATVPVFPDKDPDKSSRGGRARETAPTPPPAEIVPSADLIPATQTNDPPAPYVRLGFVPSQIEPTIGGITPPSEFCAAHQPNGTEGDCHPCGRARRYRWNTWPLTDDGMTYNRDGSTMTTMARNQGKKRAKLAPLALAGGISIDEQQTRAVELMKRIGAQPPRGALPPGDDKGLDWLALGPQDGNGGQP